MAAIAAVLPLIGAIGSAVGAVSSVAGLFGGKEESTTKSLPPPPSSIASDAGQEDSRGVLDLQVEKVRERKRRQNRSTQAGLTNLKTAPALGAGTTALG